MRCRDICISHSVAVRAFGIYSSTLVSSRQCPRLHVNIGFRSREGIHFKLEVGIVAVLYSHLVKGLTRCTHILHRGHCPNGCAVSVVAKIFSRERFLLEQAHAAAIVAIETCAVLCSINQTGVVNKHLVAHSER